MDDDPKPKRPRSSHAAPTSKSKRARRQGVSGRQNDELAHLADGCPVLLKTVMEAFPQRRFWQDKVLDPQEMKVLSDELKQGRALKRQTRVSREGDARVFLDVGILDHKELCYVVFGKTVRCPRVTDNNVVSTAQFCPVIPNKRAFGVMTGGGVPPTDKSLKIRLESGYVEVHSASPTINISAPRTLEDVTRVTAQYRIACARLGIRVDRVRCSISQIQFTFGLFNQDDGLGIDLLAISQRYPETDYNPNQISRISFQTDCFKKVLMFATGAGVILCCISTLQAQEVMGRLFRWVKPFICIRPTKGSPQVDADSA